MGDLASLKAFAIVILGGLGSIPGATIGGFILAFMEELGAGYVSSGFRDGMGFLLIIAHPDLQADGAVRAEGADRVKRALTAAWLALPGVRAAVARRPLRPARADHHRHLHHRRHEPEPAARLHRPAEPRPRRLLRHRRLRLEPGVARLRGAPAARLAGDAGAQARLARHAVRRSSRRAVRLGDRQGLLQGARRLFRHRHRELRRGRPPRRAQLGRADAGPMALNNIPALRLGIPGLFELRFLRKPANY